MTAKTGLISAGLWSVSGLLISGAVTAAPLWSDNSLSVLRGQNHVDFYPDKSEQTVLTLEHASGHQWGGLFLFVDRTEKNNAPAGFDKHTTYGEISPDISLSYLTGQALKWGAIKDITLSGTYEFGGQMDNYLYGIGIDWQVPFLNRFSSKVYYANNALTESDVQLTLTWGYTLPVDGADISFDGYLDWSSARADHQADLHFNPQLLVDVSPFVGLTQSKLQAGFEYSYWRNKYGVAALDDESVFSLMVKYHL